MIAERAAENSKAIADQRDLSKRTSDDYEIKIERLTASIVLLVLLVGCIPATAGRSSTAGEAITSGPFKPNEAASEADIPGAATERIPELTEERLYALAKRADEMAE